MGCIVQEIDNGAAIGASPVPLRTTWTILMPVISFQNKVASLGYQRKWSQQEGFLQRILGQGYKTQDSNQINNLMTDNYKCHKLADRKIFLGLILGNIFINGLTKSKHSYQNCLYTRNLIARNIVSKSMAFILSGMKTQKLELPPGMGS